MRKKIIKKEELRPELEQFVFYQDAFLELDTDRPSSMGIAPIPFTSIVNYAKIYEIDDLEEFIYLVRRMDNKFLQLNKVKDGGTKSD